MEEFDESPRNSREGSLEDIEVPTVSLETMNAMNYYSVLGLKSDATDKEINKAFKHLVVRYNPDRNPGNAEAAEKHKIVNRAYETLKDPKKRAEYDKPQITEEDPSTVDGEKMKEGEPGSQQPGTLASFTKVFSSFSAPSLPSVSLSFKQAAEGISTKAPLSPEFVEMATAICSGGALSNDSSFVDTRVSDVIWGWPIEGRVDRLGGQFYRLCLNLEEIENGFLITARSPAKDRFKIAIFDKSATMVMLEESMRSRDGKCTEICMHFTEFETYRDTPNASAPTPTVKEEAVFAKLDGFAPSKRRLEEGNYIIGVYGDNQYIGKSNFNFVVLPANNKAKEVEELTKFDVTILESKKTLETVRAEYLEAKAQYEDSLAKLTIMNEQIDSLLDSRDGAYRGFETASMLAHAPNAAATALAAGTGSFASASSNTVGPTTEAQEPTAESSSAGEDGRSRNDSKSVLTERINLFKESANKSLSSASEKISHVERSINSAADATTNWFASKISNASNSLFGESPAKGKGGAEEAEAPEAVSVAPSGGDGGEEEPPKAPALTLSPDNGDGWRKGPPTPDETESSGSTVTGTDTSTTTAEVENSPSISV